MIEGGAMSQDNKKAKKAREEIASLQNQLTEAQGKRGKVVSVKEIKNIFLKWDDERIGDESYDMWVEKLATAIHIAVYGEGEDEG
jgi:hypothetical protein